jgi:hypothetical protein
MLLICNWDVLVQVSARIPAILTEVFHGFPEFLQENERIVPQLDHDYFISFLLFITASAAGLKSAKRYNN